MILEEWAEWTSGKWNRSTLRACTIATLLKIYPTWLDSGLELGRLRSEAGVNNINYGTANVYVNSYN